MTMASSRLGKHQQDVHQPHDRRYRRRRRRRPRSGPSTMPTTSDRATTTDSRSSATGARRRSGGTGYRGPTSSVPSGKRQDAAVAARPAAPGTTSRNCSIGECGATQSAKIADDDQHDHDGEADDGAAVFGEGAPEGGKASPAAADRVRRRCRSSIVATSASDPRIEEAVGAGRRSRLTRMTRLATSSTPPCSTG